MVGRVISISTAIIIVLSSAPLAVADVSNARGDNAQEGDNESDSDQRGEAESGDVVNGQVVGIVSSGDAEVDARNRSVNVDARSGDASGANDVSAFVGQDASRGLGVSDLANVTARNIQEGDNEFRSDQMAQASSGDAVGGQVAGVVGDGDVDAIFDNLSVDVDLRTGDADTENDGAAFVGLHFASPPPPGETTQFVRIGLEPAVSTPIPTSTPTPTVEPEQPVDPEPEQ